MNNHLSITGIPCQTWDIRRHLYVQYLQLLIYQGTDRLSPDFGSTCVIPRYSTKTPKLSPAQYNSVQLTRALIQIPDPAQQPEAP
jgi:hypothetical protein